MEQYMKVLKSFKRFPIAMQHKLHENVKRVVVRKNDIIQKKGEIANRIYFIETGLVRGFCYVNRRQQTDWFKKENDFVLCLQRLFSKPLPFPTIIEALEDSVLWDFPGDFVEELCHEFPIFNEHYSIMMLKDLAKRTDENHAIRTDSPTEIYNYLRQHDPGLLNRVPAQYLASYMNTTLAIFNHIHKTQISLHMLSSRRKKEKER